MPVTPQQLLSDILRDLFTETELHELARRLPEGQEIATSLPGAGSSRALVAANLAEAVQRYGVIEEMLQELVAARSRQRERLIQLARAWGKALPSSPSQPPLSTPHSSAWVSGTRRRRYLHGALAATLVLVVGVALAAISDTGETCFPDQDQVPGIELAREACAAYVDTMRAYNENDLVRYHAGFAEPMECFYNLSNTSIRQQRKTTHGSVDVDAHNLSFLRLESDSRVVMCDLGVFDRGDGEGRKPHSKAIVMVKQVNDWHIVIETTRGASACYVSPC